MKVHKVTILLFEKLQKVDSIPTKKFAKRLFEVVAFLLHSIYAIALGPRNKGEVDVRVANNSNHGGDVMNIEDWGLLGVFIAGAIPWMEAIAVVPSGIALGLNPYATVIAAAIGNAITIFLFAFLSDKIRQRIINRRISKGKSGDSAKFEKALKAFDKYGVYGMAFLGPIIIGTQFAAAASVAAGVKPLRASLLVTTSMAVWASLIAFVMVALDINFEVLQER